MHNTHTYTCTQTPNVLAQFFGVFVAEGMVNAKALLQPVLDEPPESPEDSTDPPMVERGGLAMVLALFAKCVACCYFYQDYSAQCSCSCVRKCCSIEIRLWRTCY